MVVEGEGGGVVGRGRISRCARKEEWLEGAGEAALSLRTGTQTPPRKPAPWPGDHSAIVQAEEWVLACHKHVVRVRAADADGSAPHWSARLSICTAGGKRRVEADCPAQHGCMCRKCSPWESGGRECRGTRCTRCIQGKESGRCTVSARGTGRTHPALHNLSKMDTRRTTMPPTLHSPRSVTAGRGDVPQMRHCAPDTYEEHERGAESLHAPRIASKMAASEPGASILMSCWPTMLSSPACQNKNGSHGLTSMWCANLPREQL